MRSIRLAGVLLLLIAATAAAQVPRTINFQGRIRDAAGVFLDGPRSCTLRIYEQETGGSAIFTEVYPAIFDNGTFTIRIGARTPGGIPESVPFDKEYWLGCTVDGFNNNQEIAPRMRMSSSPYALRAAIADTAIYADDAGYAASAGTLGAPANISGSHAGPEPVLTVSNDDGPIGFLARGSSYAIISDGVDSTSQHFVSGQNADGATPSPGAIYRDNAPMAWGLVASNGTIIGGFGIRSVTRNSAGNFVVTLANDARIDTDSKQPMLAPMVQSSGLTNTATAASTAWYFRSGNPRDIYIQMRNGQGLGEDYAFSIIVFGRPE